jgi:O-glycosyl hydrolase
MRHLVHAVLVAFGLVCTSGWTAEVAQTDRNGRIRAMDLQGDVLDIRTDLRIPLAGWKRIPGLDTAKAARASESDGKRTWSGRIELEPGQPYDYEESIEEKQGMVRLACRVISDSDVKTEGVYLWLDLPISVFGGGDGELSLGQAMPKTAELPKERPPQRHFLSAQASRMAFIAPTGKPRLDLTLDPPCDVTVQDNREWDAPTYSALVRLPGGPLAKGQSATLNVTLKLAGEADQTPATLTLDASKPRYRLDGFGGNYCFNIESPVSQYTLDHLRVAWARTEMTLSAWEPENDNDSPQDTHWAYRTSHDQPETRLRREFLLAQQLQKRGIPYVASIWRLPEWLYADPGKGPDAAGRRVAPDRWPQLLGCIGSYLVYAKKQYGVEPDLFSFNEPDWGVRVKFSPEEHRDAIKRIGSHLKSLGLRTKMLLADVTNPRGTHTYALPTAKDPEAMAYVGALGVHSWGGATPEQYGAWADLADKLKLPLLVSELGVDGGAWQGRAYETFAYALREVRMYQELVLHARPRGTMQWEFTSDYGIVREQRDAAKKVVGLTPTARFWFVKHFCDLTPPNSSVLATASDHPNVLLTAFAGGSEKEPAYTLHVANLAAERPVVIRGIPESIKSFRAIRTSETDAFKELPAFSVENGTIKATLARQSLLTLTSLPVQ